MALKPIKVSQLNKYIGRVMQTDPILSNVSVTGEISNLKYHNSGHVYFTLKDETSKINCFMPDRTVAQLRYELTDGMEVVISGGISVYEKGGYYSLTVRNIEVSGSGNLAMAFKAMYERLEKEGLFAAEHKKPLPVFPKRVCVITSPTGAAVRDILKIIRTRNDYVNVLVYPCLVQGDAAAADISRAIAHVNERFSDVDVIIVGRGGGSLEELWAFNEEIVARSIFESEIPVISAVGHETDFSISDYAADRRAETPTAAAVMAVPDMREVRAVLQSSARTMSDALDRMLKLRRESLERYSPQNMKRIFSSRIQYDRQQTGYAYAIMKADMRLRLQEASSDVEKMRIMLEAGNPERIIRRGYAVIRDAETGKILTSASDMKPGMSITVTMKDGSVSADVAEQK